MPCKVFCLNFNSLDEVNVLCWIDPADIDVHSVVRSYWWLENDRLLWRLKFIWDYQWIYRIWLCFPCNEVQTDANECDHDYHAKYHVCFPTEACLELLHLRVLIWGWHVYLLIFLPSFEYHSLSEFIITNVVGIGSISWSIILFWSACRFLVRLFCCCRLLPLFGSTCRLLFFNL